MTYGHYVAMLDGITAYRTASRTLQAGIFDDLKSLGLGGALTKFFLSMKNVFQRIVAASGLAISDLAMAFKQRDVFGLLRAIGFNLKKMLMALDALSHLANKGLLYVLEDIAKSPAMEQIRKGTAKIDDFFEQHPILKRLAGPALAGLLFYIWMSGMIIGGSRADYDWTPIAHALTGQFSITDLFTSKEGLVMLALFAGGFTGIGLAWIAADQINMMIALAYTGLRLLHDSKLAEKLAHLIHFSHVK